MNAKTIETNWAEIKGKINSKWSKISEDDVEAVKADLSLLSGKIEKAYGIAKDYADRQFDEFKHSLGTLVGQVTEAPKAAAPAPAAAAAPTVENKVSQAV